MISYQILRFYLKMRNQSFYQKFFFSWRYWALFLIKVNCLYSTSAVKELEQIQFLTLFRQSRMPPILSSTDAFSSKYFITSFQQENVRSQDTVFAMAGCTGGYLLLQNIISIIFNHY